MSDNGVVYVVDDDPRVREALGELLESNGLSCRSFASAADYMAFERADAPACLILDVELPDINGLELQKRIAGDAHPPVVFLTGHGDIPSSVQAIKGGAVDFLTKPVRQDALLAAVHAGLDRDRLARASHAEASALMDRLGTLTPREQEVLPLVVSGLLNKQAASQLGISDVTLQIHRRRIMQKMKAASLADLVRMAERLRIPVTHTRRTGTTPE
ncbi:MAG: response regulator [Hansschlegelia sp.]